jgi:hypothetical protein
MLRRIVTFEQFMRTPRTPLEVESYHVLLAQLQRMGMVDKNLNILRPARRRRTVSARLEAERWLTGVSGPVRAGVREA